MMNRIEDIQKRILTYELDLPKTVFIREKDNLLLLNYKPEVQIQDKLKIV